MIKNLRLCLVTIFLMIFSVNAYSQACSGNNVTITFENFTTGASSQISSSKSWYTSVPKSWNICGTRRFLQFRK